MDQCGRCHAAITASYFETYHGKISKLGYLKTAKCYDCHGSHDVLPVTDPRSRLSRANIVKTCAQCHTKRSPPVRRVPDARHASRPGPLPHPVLHVLGMTTLLLGTFVVSGAHTHCGCRVRCNTGGSSSGSTPSKAGLRARFRTYERNLHLIVITSFIGLASTGMILKFSYAPWASVGRGCWAGSKCRLIHRLCALLTFTYFGAHLWDVRRKAPRQRV